MNTELLNKQEALVKKYNELRKILLTIENDMVLRIAFAEVFNQPETEIKPSEAKIDPKVLTLRGMRIHAGYSQENASKAIHKAKTYVLRLETGKAALDKSTEKKLTELYSKKEETT